VKNTAPLILLTLALFYTPTAQADSFGSGANQFDIEFVSIGGLDNPDDITGDPNPAGKVEYGYRMGKYEISEDMINKANVLGGLGITHDNRGANKPATSIIWFEAARFVNWLNTSTGRTPAYKFNGSAFELWQSGDAGYNPVNPFRNSQAFYFLPSADEWYKAAYYDPNAGVYHDYPTGNDSVPDGIDFAGDTMFDAVFFDNGFNPQPNDVTDVGVLSSYGTAGQGGNAWEWEETDFDLVNDSSSSARGGRGGGWSDGDSGSLLATLRLELFPTFENDGVGFRVASIPEPSTAHILFSLAMIGLGLTRRR
jgi:formylglycine-generating enzyme required for sulfatase activity